MEEKKDPSVTEAAKVKEANTVIAIGAGVGALGAGAALLGGALCPLCIFVAPGLVGLGVVQRIRAGRKK